MQSSIGQILKLTTFGESHGPAIGLVLDGLPAGFPLDLDQLQDFLNRRRPGKRAWATQRQEDDRPEILSGYYQGRLTGAPLAALIRNKDQRSQDYEKILDRPRPSHADWNAQVKFAGAMDLRGGGPFSGRLTAPICLAGGIAKQILSQQGIEIAAHISNIAGISDQAWNPMGEDPELLSQVQAKDFPVLSDPAGEKMQEAIEVVRQEKDSIGGQIETLVQGLPQGLGEPNFGKIQARLGQLVFSIPAVKGLIFGRGQEVATSRGSDFNDGYQLVDGQVQTKTNHAGGLAGGMTTGQPLLFETFIKPPSSIGLSQDSFSIQEGLEKKLVIEGRHDPCIVPRAVPVMEAVAALVIYDSILVAKEPWPNSR